ncbi:hypothetical protein [Devosia sp.]|uniref:hypothetical protein n=1 Tax=Devosia sp. TaxID=1871048 RepID=UPI003A8E5AD2
MGKRRTILLAVSPARNGFGASVATDKRQITVSVPVVLSHAANTHHKRIYWNALDIILGRPALSRWHADFKEAFAAFMQRDLPK